jgi:hypothetical protein
MGYPSAYLSEADLATRYLLMDTSEFPAMGAIFEMPIFATASEPRAAGSTVENAIVIESDSEETINEDQAQESGQSAPDTTPECIDINSDEDSLEVCAMRRSSTKEDDDESDDAGAEIVTSGQPVVEMEPVFRGRSSNMDEKFDQTNDAA